MKTFTKPTVLFLILIMTIIACTPGDRTTRGVRGAVVTKVSGTVFLTRPSMEPVRFEPTNIGTKNGVLMPHDQVQTEEKSSLTFYTPGGGLVVVKEKSTVVIGEVLGFPELHKSDTGIELKEGEIFSHIKKLQSNSEFRVITPTSVAMVRGTEFIMRNNGSSSQTLVKEGSVRVEDPQGMTGENLGEGEKATVTDQSEFTTGTLSPEERDAFPDSAGSELEEVNRIYEGKMENLLQSFAVQSDSIQGSFRKDKQTNRERIDAKLDENQTNIDTKRNENKELIQKTNRTNRQPLEKVQQENRENLKRVRQDSSEDMESTKEDASQRMEETKRETGEEIQQSEARSQIDLIRSASPAPTNAQPESTTEGNQTKP